MNQTVSVTISRTLYEIMPSDLAALLHNLHLRRRARGVRAPVARGTASKTPRIAVEATIYQTLSYDRL